jgi:hypothetical protein
MILNKIFNEHYQKSIYNPLIKTFMTLSKVINDHPNKNFNDHYQYQLVIL